MSFRIVRNPRSPIVRTRPAYAVLGNLDGVHRGHRALFARAVSLASEHGQPYDLLAISFYPHPIEVLKGIRIPRLTNLRQKARVLQELDVDELVLLHFTREFSRISAASFIDEILIKRLQLSYLVLGPDAAIGRNREGDANAISRLLRKRGVGCDIFDFVQSDGQKIGSSAIREAVLRGDLETARNLLGRSFSVTGRVVKGAQVGRTLGYPTANVRLANQLLPPTGIYAAQVTLQDHRYIAAVNVGCNPTLNTVPAPRVECYLIDYRGDDFYSEIIEVHFEEFISSEEKLSGVDELIEKIGRDVEAVRAYFKK